MIKMLFSDKAYEKMRGRLYNVINNIRNAKDLEDAMEIAEKENVFALPVAPGDTVYHTENRYNALNEIPQKARVISFYYNEDRCEIWFNFRFGKSRAVSGFALSDLHEKVFLSKRDYEIKCLSRKDRGGANSEND